MSEAKPYEIAKWDVWKAFEKVRANHGAAGIDGQSIEDFEQNVQDNLYKIWNRMSSGSYVPPPVRTVEIPKGNGKMRPLGIPTVGDRVAQQVAKQYLEPLVDPCFHADSYGYRPGKSALDAVAVTRKRCWRQNWVIDLDIKGFFDNLDHDLILRAVRHHTDCKWVLLYIERWLKAPAQLPNGQIVERTKGTPQGGVISPLLANLFMHYAFDTWITRNCPGVQFARYADDAVVHAKSLRQAHWLLKAITCRLKECGLEVHPEKTKIVYCRDDHRIGDFDHVSFDFLGYSFQPRRAKSRHGDYFVSFLPAISQKAAKKIRATIREWRIPSARNVQKIEDIAQLVNPSVRGWMNYYGKFYPAKVKAVLNHLEWTLMRWACSKFKPLRGRITRAHQWLAGVEGREPQLFVHWQLGITSTARIRRAV